MPCRRILESGHCRRNARRPRAPLEVGASPTDKAGEQQRGHAYFAVGDCEAFLAQPWVVAGLMQRTQLADLSTTPEKPKNMPIAIAAPLRSTAAARRTAERGIPGEAGVSPSRGPSSVRPLQVHRLCASGRSRREDTPVRTRQGPHAPPRRLHRGRILGHLPTAPMEGA